MSELLGLIKEKFPDLTVSTHFEDFDDYGCEDYILIAGICADIRLNKKYRPREI